MQAVSGNIIPKCEPRITLNYLDAEGIEQTVVWNAKDIKDFNYKQGADPLNRTLPFIEASWTELYYGDLDENGEPAKYNNVGQFGLVTIEFVQDLMVGLNQWKSLYNQGVKWSDLLSTTWKKILKSRQQEVIEMPKLFLSAKPEIKDKTITWKAIDLLNIMTMTQNKAFGGAQIVSGGSVWLPGKNIISNLILDERAAFLKSPYVLQAITETVDWYFSEENHVGVVFAKPFLISDTTRNAILNIANLCNIALKFDGNKLKISNVLMNETNKTPFTKSNLKKYPILTKNPNISSYQKSVYDVYVDMEKIYEIFPNFYEKDNRAIGYWFFDGFGVPIDNDMSSVMNIHHNYKYAVQDEAEIGDNPSMYVAPIKTNKTEKIVNFNQQGEAFIEDNPIDVYGDGFEGWVTHRRALVRKYFSNGACSIEFEAFPNLAFEVGDVVGVETNLKLQGQSIVKNAVIVEMELNYNGALIEKIKAHEVVS